VWIKTAIDIPICVDCKSGENICVMNSHNLNWVADFIWGIADDVLRDVYVRGKYRDVISKFSGNPCLKPTR